MPNWINPFPPRRAYSFHGYSKPMKLNYPEEGEASAMGTFGSRFFSIWIIGAATSVVFSPVIQLLAGQALPAAIRDTEFMTQLQGRLSLIGWGIILLLGQSWLPFWAVRRARDAGLSLFQSAPHFAYFGVNCTFLLGSLILATPPIGSDAVQLINVTILVPALWHLAWLSGRPSSAGHEPG
ncbi:hypothetical protein [Maricaulis sp.]|uniref:hypothetical protein n=1 Tax=Maricaulis sp. TaxID=1486257 RepID=UPI001B094F93|nr:hypothetical protein [Maricaulis sp.]MBO6796702.1 hypothetical protein [Maricaulis sp.]